MANKNKDKDNPFSAKANEAADIAEEQDIFVKSGKTSDEPANSELQQKLDALNQQYIRLAADFDNYRKRQDAEREDLLNFGTRSTLTKMLDVLDNFERGEKALENVTDAEQAKESFRLVYKQTLDALQKLGMEVIETEGKEFDPNFHDAVMQTPTDEYAEHTIINELQKGYKIGDKVLRAALVNVATGQVK